MMVDLQMKDGRTLLRFATRGKAVEAMTRRPLTMEAENHRGVLCWALWHTKQTEWSPTRMVSINPSSVAFVRQVPVEERDQFLEEHDPELLAKFKAKENAA